MTDPNKKVSRQFQCREALWQKFEQMAKELECSVDYLINDAMKQYARQRGYGAAATLGSTAPASIVGAPPPPPPPSSAPAHAAPTAPPQAAAVPPLGAPPPPAPPPLPMSAGGSGLAFPPPPPPGAGRPTPPPKRGVGAPPPPPPPPPGARRGPPPLAPPRSMPPPVPSGSVRPQGALAIHYQGEVFPVTKDRFIIGRGKQTSDLTIKDPNVSRQHAMIEFTSGQYFIVDMGSTNGVEFNGQRIQRRAIGEGDVFKVCDHELRFSFQ